MGCCIMRFGETFEGVGATIYPTEFRAILLSFSVYSIFLHRLKQTQTTLSCDAQRGVVPVLTQ